MTTETKYDIEFYEYLDELRRSGVTNMYGARPYFMDHFDMDEDDREARNMAHLILIDWQETFSVRRKAGGNRRLGRRTDMAHGYWPDYTPGSRYGPCTAPCAHTDCARMRDSAFTEPPCKECGVKMVTGEPFFNEAELGQGRQPIHARHVWDREDAQ